jgi:UDP-3-O-acyl-N-acetylglucosamine deacetylase
MAMSYPAKEEYMRIFRRFMEQRTEDMEAYVKSCMKDDGLTEEDSQRMVLINRIKDLEAAIAGTEISDLIISEDK